MSAAAVAMAPSARIATISVVESLPVTALGASGTFLSGWPAAAASFDTAAMAARARSLLLLCGGLVRDAAAMVAGRVSPWTRSRRA